MPVMRRNGVDICYESCGETDKPAILLIMGLGMQLIAWPEDFVQGLVARGFRVIRFDNRDVGLSTHYDGARTPGLWRTAMMTRFGLRPALPYTLNDMADDCAALLDELGVARAHVVGVSMGGMIAQLVAARHPARVASLTSIMSSSGNPWLKPPRRDALKMLMSRPRLNDRDAIIGHFVRLFQTIGSPAFPTPDAELRARAGLSLDRAYDPAGVGRQLLAIVASGDRRKLLRRIAAPTLVVHGAADPLVRPDAGRDTAKSINGAKLVMIEGMGHDLPAPLCDRLVGAIADHCAAAAVAA
jgi:pimeloyl-ACP methyl ester carboxylesterase